MPISFMMLLRYVSFCSGPRNDKLVVRTFALISFSCKAKLFFCNHIEKQLSYPRCRGKTCKRTVCHMVLNVNLWDFFDESMQMVKLMIKMYLKDAPSLCVWADTSMTRLTTFLLFFVSESTIKFFCTVLLILFSFRTCKVLPPD